MADKDQKNTNQRQNEAVKEQDKQESSVDQSTPQVKTPEQQIAEAATNNPAPSDDKAESR